MSAMDIRDAFFNEVYRIGAEDSRVVVLTNDMDVFGLRQFKQNFPERFVNVGVAEQNMIDVAAGLAACGKRPLIFGIASFVSFRCYEQIKMSVCAMDLPVVIAAVGAGFSFPFDGPSHHGTQDFGVMRMLPEMTIYNPGDLGMAEAAAGAALSADGPSYVRIDKGPFPRLHAAEMCAQGFARVSAGDDVTLVASGAMVAQAMTQAERLRAAGISAGVVDLFRPWPLPAAFVTDILAGARRVVTLEDNCLSGGIGTIVAEAVVDAGLSTRVLRIAGIDAQFHEYGSREFLNQRAGVDPAAILARIEAWLKG